MRVWSHDVLGERLADLDRIQEGGQLPQVHTVHLNARLVEVRSGSGQFEELRLPLLAFFQGRGVMSS